MPWFPWLYKIRRFGLQNGPFYITERAVSQLETARFALSLGVSRFILCVL